jgi:hypothetical protein
MSSEEPLYISLYYKLVIEDGVPINSTNTDIVNTESGNNTYSSISSFYMTDMNGNYNKDIITYNGFTIPGSSSLLIPTIFYELMTIVTSKGDEIQSSALYSDSGSGGITTIPQQDFAVLAANGIFNTATLVRVLYYDDYSRQVIIMNDAYLNSISEKQSKMNEEITLYYSTIVSKETPIDNNTNLNLQSFKPSNDFAVISNRYMEDENGQPNKNIISYIGYRISGNSALLIPPLYYETLIILSENNDYLQAAAVYPDTGTGAITTVPFVDFPVNGGLGIFSNAINVRVFYDNINLKRRVFITNYYPTPPPPPVPPTFPITLRYSRVLSLQNPILNNTLIDFFTYAPATQLGVITCRYMLGDNNQPNDSIICFNLFRMPKDPINLIPSQLYANFIIFTPEGDILQASNVLTDSGNATNISDRLSNYAVLSAKGKFIGAKNVLLISDATATQRILIITN